MKLQGKSRIATLAMMELAVYQGKGLVTIAEIASHLHISLSYLEQLFADLRRDGLVKGTRGPGGGYELGRELDQISIFQIVEAVEEKNADIEPRTDGYLPDQMWKVVADSLNRHLQQVSLKDLLDQSIAKGRDHTAFKPFFKGELVAA